MSTFLHHSPCPECGSRDNLGIYDDHEYCFGCGYLKYYTRNYYRSKAKGEGSPNGLPDDVTPMLPDYCSDWLNKYEITPEEIKSNRILWSDNKKYLCFPYFGSGNNLEAWQARYFGDNPKHPKWVSYGKIKDHIKIFNPQGLDKYGLIVVEDILSAIKVGRQFPCSPLFGSTLSWENVARYGRYVDKIILWLDEDKSKEAHKYARRASMIGLKTAVIYTEYDPKEYSDSDINEIVSRY